MSDVMLIGVLRMPPDLWRDDALDVSQRHSRYIEAADRIESDAAQIESLEIFRRDAKVENAELHSQIESLQRENDRIRDLQRDVHEYKDAEYRAQNQLSTALQRIESLQRENEGLREKHDALWMLLDDIDTADDMFKEDHKAFQGYAYRKQRERFAVSPEPIGSTSLPKAAITPEMRETAEKWLKDYAPGHTVDYIAMALSGRVIIHDLLGKQG